MEGAYHIFSPRKCILLCLCETNQDLVEFQESLLSWKNKAECRRVKRHLELEAVSVGSGQQVKVTADFAPFLIHFRWWVGKEQSIIPDDVEWGNQQRRREKPPTLPLATGYTSSLKDYWPGCLCSVYTSSRLGPLLMRNQEIQKAVNIFSSSLKPKTTCQLVQLVVQCCIEPTFSCKNDQLPEASQVWSAHISRQKNNSYSKNYCKVRVKSFKSCRLLKNYLKAFLLLYIPTTVPPPSPLPAFPLPSSPSNPPSTPQKRYDLMLLSIHTR